MDNATLVTEAGAVKMMEKLRQDVSDNITAQGLRASGRSQQSMRVEQNGNKLTLYGRPFFAALETGSSGWSGKTGVRCTVKEFVGIIREWITAKGIKVEDEDKAANAIARSIIRKGTKRHQQVAQGAKFDVFSSLVEKFCSDLAASVQVAVSANVTDSILKCTTQKKIGGN